MTTRESYSLALGRAAHRVEAGWTQGAYSRHSDGRALQVFGVRSHTVDIAGALYQVSAELGLTDKDFENLRYLVTAHLPSPYSSDEAFGIERFNDRSETTLERVVYVIRQAQEDYEWGGVLNRFGFATIAA